MFSSLRRGPVSLSRTLQNLTRSQFSPVLPRLLLQCAPKAQLAPRVRALHSTSRLLQHAGYGNQPVREDLDQELLSGSPTQGAEDIITRFEDLKARELVCPTVINTLTRGMRLETMTPVQSQTIHETLKGVDV